MIVEALMTYLVMHIELTLKVMTPTHYPHLKVLKLVLTMKVVEKIAQRAHVDLERSDQEGSSRLVRSPQSLRVVLQMPLKIGLVVVDGSV